MTVKSGESGELILTTIMSVEKLLGLPFVNTSVRLVMVFANSSAVLTGPVPGGYILICTE
jgi:hypothetical protein